MPDGKAQVQVRQIATEGWSEVNEPGGGGSGSELAGGTPPPSVEPIHTNEEKHCTRVESNELRDHWN